MKVLMITGDTKMRPGHPRFDLQAAAVEKLVPLYWGRGSLWPKIPPGHFDVVTAQDPFWRGHVAWHMARRLRARLNIQVHTDISAYALPWWLWARFHLRRADSVRVVSEKIRQQVLKMGVRAPVSVLPIFVDIEPFKNLQHRSHPRFAKTILWIGRFEKEKDPLYALGVLRAVHHAGFEAGLIMLGDGSLRERLQAAAAGLPVEFPGWQDPKRYLEQADVVLSTSLHESWGASIVEALAAGVAVVAPDVGVAREAGATLARRSELGAATIAALRSGARGALRLRLYDAQEWATKWKATL